MPRHRESATAPLALDACASCAPGPRSIRQGAVQCSKCPPGWPPALAHGAFDDVRLRACRAAGLTILAPCATATGSWVLAGHQPYAYQLRPPLGANPVVRTVTPRLSPRQAPRLLGPAQETLSGQEAPARDRPGRQPSSSQSVVRWRCSMPCLPWAFAMALYTAEGAWPRVASGEPFCFLGPATRMSSSKVWPDGALYTE